MSVDIYLKKFEDAQSILAKFMINQINNWPTTPNNIKHNCELFENLNPNGLLVSGLDENSDYYKLCRDYAYISQALKQRGLMNMSYYLSLDKLFNSNDENETELKPMVGGVKFQDLMIGTLTSFSLMAKTEGQHSGNQNVIANKNDSNSLFLPSEAPVENRQQLNDYRKKEAQKQFDSLMQIQPWIFPEIQITIADNLTQQQMEYYTSYVSDLNLSLQSLSRDATYHCSSIAGRAETMGVFSNEDLYKKIAEVAEAIEAKQTEKRTAETLQDALSYLGRAVHAVGSSVVSGTQGVASAERQINSTEALNLAYQLVSDEINQGLIGQTESVSYSMQYQALCRTGTPSPRFILESSNTNSLYSIKFSSRFGNHATSTLLIFHIKTIEKINLKMQSLDNSTPEFRNLKSLKERMQIEKQLIESSILFAPLDFVGGIEGFSNIIAQGKKASLRFGSLVKQMSEYLPITEEDFRYSMELDKKIETMREEVRQQIISGWISLIETSQKTATSVLGNTIKNVAEVGVNAMQSMEDVGIKTVQSTGNIVKKATDTTLDLFEETFWRFAPIILILLGSSGLAMYMMVWFKKNMMASNNPVFLSNSQNIAGNIQNISSDAQNILNNSQNVSSNSLNAASNSQNVLSNSQIVEQKTDSPLIQSTAATNQSQTLETGGNRSRKRKIIKHKKYKTRKNNKKRKCSKKIRKYKVKKTKKNN